MSRRRLFALSGLAALLAAMSVAVPRSTPPAGAAVGLTLVGTAAAGPYQNFYPRATHESFSGVAVGDVRGSGHPQLVVGGMDGCVRIYDTPSLSTIAGCIYTGAGAIQSTPVLADWNGDGTLDILVANNTNGQVFVFSGTGQVLFWAQDDPTVFHGIFGTPAVGDIDHDGRLDVVATSWDHRIWAWRHDGSVMPGFPRLVYDTIWSGPALADLDGDGWLEVVTGTDMDYGNAANDPPYNLPPGGLVWVVRHDGSLQPGWPRSIPGGQVIWSSPAVTDLDHNGSRDVVVGTGVNFPPPAGQSLHALSSTGNYLPGWPRAASGRIMGGPAIGDLGNGQNDVVSVTDDGRLNANRADGTQLWNTCAMSFTPCGGSLGAAHGGAAIADVNNDHVMDVVYGGEQYMRVYDGRNGAMEAQAVMSANTWAPASTPTVAQVGGQTWIIQSVTDDVARDGHPGPGDVQRIYVWTTGTALGAAPWPTFKQNLRRTGTVLDTNPPIAVVTSPAPPADTRTTVSWIGTDLPASGETASGVASYDVDVSDDAGGGWSRWQDRTAATSGSLFGIVGHSYGIRARATDGAGNAGAWSAPVGVAFPAVRDPNQPFTAAYAVNRVGQLSGVSSPPATGPTFGFDATRGLAMLPGGGGYVADAFGGIHAFGGAPSGLTGGYWKGWDIVRGIAMNPHGDGGYLLDGFGGLHPLGGAASGVSAGYWPGWDIARGVVLLPTSTASAPAGYVLDGFGGVHPFGAAPAVRTTGYWPGWNIVRGFAIDPDSPTPAGYVLDGWGGIHPFGSASSVASGGYWKGWDIARSIAMVAGPSPAGYVLDGFGGLHPFGGAPAVTVTRYWGYDTGREVAIAP